MADRSFGPTVLAGLASAGLLALAGNSDWMDTGRTAERAPGQAFVEIDAGVGQMPLAGALGLVLLACWGVLLVSRGRWRRVLAWGALATAVGVAVVWVVGLVTLEDQVREALAASGPDPLRGAVGSPSWTWWFWLAGASVLVAVAAAVVAVRRVGAWPAMGEKYDAPTGRAGSDTATATGTGPGVVGDAAGSDPGDGEVDPADWWKAIDEGRDPTGGDAP